MKVVNSATISFRHSLFSAFPLINFPYLCQVSYLTQAVNYVYASKDYDIYHVLNASLITSVKDLTWFSIISLSDISDASLLSDQDQYIFIGSEKFIHNKDLLHLLETCHNVMIYERRRSKTKSEDSLNKVLLQPDVMIDERTCIHLQHLSSLTDENEYKGLRDVVLSMSLKCHKCHIIMYSNKQPEYVSKTKIIFW